jgi:hypothetical protein
MAPEQGAELRFTLPTGFGLGLWLALYPVQQQRLAMLAGVQLCHDCWRWSACRPGGSTRLGRLGRAARQPRCKRQESECAIGSHGQDPPWRLPQSGQKAADVGHRRVLRE